MKNLMSKQAFNCMMVDHAVYEMEYVYGLDLKLVKTHAHQMCKDKGLEPALYYVYDMARTIIENSEDIVAGMSIESNIGRNAKISGINTGISTCYHIDDYCRSLVDYTGDGGKCTRCGVILSSREIHRIEKEIEEFKSL